MKTTHTPGPWAVTPQGDGVHDWAVISKETGKYICRVNAFRCSEHLPTNDANSRLIAAAPEMLAELRRLEEVFQSMARSAEKYGLPGTFAEGCELNGKSIRSAIARATQP